MKHPLEPLNEEEIQNVVEIFKNSEFGKTGRIIYLNIQLLEPSKEALLTNELQENFDRKVKLCGRNCDSLIAGFIATIDLLGKNVVEFQNLPDNAQPPLNEQDVEVANQIIWNDPECLKVLLQYGITNEDIKAGKLIIENWPESGYTNSNIPKGHRGARSTLFYKERMEDSKYARPLQNLIIHIDLTTKTVADIEFHGLVPLRHHVDHDHWDKDMLKTRNTIIRPLKIVQPEGASFIIKEHHIKWDHWSLRVSMHPIHGLVLHQLSYDSRPILFRAAMADMVVPYGDPDPMHSWKQVLDASEYNIGTLCNSLQNGCDCLGVIHYFDVCHVGLDGTPQTVKNAICLHEEDHGIAWKHATFHRNKDISISRRNRRLVISSFFTVDNYDYGFYWYLYFDGMIEVEVKLTGVLSVSTIKTGAKAEKFAPLCSENLAAPVHQHLFNFRMDWQLDGGLCNLYEQEVEAVSIEDGNPGGNLFEIKNRQLLTEHEAMRIINTETSRGWKITSSSSKNALGNYTAYKVLPGDSARLIPTPNSVISKRAPFARYNLWATPFSADELSAAGDNTLMSDGNDGLKVFTKNNRSLKDCDLVTWHTIGVTHVPRPEDWPIMPTATCKLTFIPYGFFDYNPCMDLPENYNMK